MLPGGAEWSQVLFRVQLILADPSVELLRVVKFGCEFEPKHSSNMKIDCAVNASRMDEQEVENLKYGNAAKYVFEAGHINLQKESKKGQASSQASAQSYRILLFKIAVDQCLPIHKSGASELAQIGEFPPSIDTIYVSDCK